VAVKEFAMPDLGEGLTESELVSWNVAVGDTVELNQVVAEVETAKALVQLPSPFAGVVARLFVEPGTTVQVGSPILAITVDDAGEPEQGPPARNAVLVGYGPPVDGSAHPRRRARVTAGSATSADERTPGVVQSEAVPSVQVPQQNGTRGGTGTIERPRTFPPVRKLAQELGVDLAQVTGTGPDGVITREDLMAWADRRTEPVQAPTPSGGGRPREVRVPITGVRKHTAAAMVRSAFTAPHATEFLTIDVTPTVELIASLATDRAFEGHRITMLTMVAKALTVALRRAPAVSSRWDEEAGEIVELGYVNLGIAAATPRGLLVPNIKDADRLDLVGLGDALADLTQAARAGTTAPADLTGGTISITNIGVFGIDAGTPILNPGEAAILAMGAVRRQPWEHRDEIALRSVMTLSLSFDHRLVDGEQASRFLADVATILREPGRTLTMV
jgi:2-oxoisovalerate dehydrogenase E2 component (dihydrolipoyl transacylase)